MQAFRAFLLAFMWTCLFVPSVRADNDLLYRQIYNAMSELDEEDFWNTSYFAEAGYRDFYSCSGAYWFSPSNMGEATFNDVDANRFLNYQMLAYDLVGFRRELNSFGKLREFEAELNRYESMVLDQILTIGPGDYLPDYESESYRLVLQIIAQLEGSKVGGVSWGVGGECGDGEIEVPISSEPQGARVWLISEFDYELCLAVGKNPDDRDACNWKEETGRDVILVAGTYRIYASWPDGSTSSGRRNFLRALEAPGSVDNAGIIVRP